ncbi:MAG: trigger factor [Myxococcales bacterium]|nr:trigger factor [Myxococcales bacterium]
MKVSVDAVTPTSRRVCVSFPATEITREFNEAYRSLNKVPLKGFRPGKTPRSVLTRYYGAKIADDIADKLVEKTVGKALVECDYPPASSVTFDRPKPQEGHDFTYTLTFHIVPVPRPLITEGLATLDGVDFSASPDEISEEMKRLRVASSELVPIEDRGAELGDIVTLNRTGLLDGIPSESLAAEDVSLKLGEERRYPEFSDALLGAKVGDTRQVTIMIPDVSFDDTNMAHDAGDQDGTQPQPPAKEATLTLVVTGVSREDLPELDDEFAKDHGFESLKELTEHVALRIKERKIKQHTSAIREQNLNTLLEMNPFPVPDEVIEDRAHASFHASNPDSGDSHDHTSEQLESHRTLVRLQLRRDSLIQELASQKQITVDHDDLESALSEIAQQFRVAPEIAMKLMGGPERSYDYLHARLLRDKTLDFLASGAHPAGTDPDLTRDPKDGDIIAENEQAAEVGA